MNIRKNKKEWRKNLIAKYHSQWDTEPKFMQLVLDIAIAKLERGNAPKYVENWVAKIEKAWRS